MTRAAGAVLLLVAGAATALAAVAVHQDWWGLLLGLAATAAALAALPAGWAGRLPFGVGWTALVAWVAPTRPEGDFVLSGDPAGYAVLAAAVVVLVVAVATLPRSRRAVPGRGPAGS